MGGMRVMGHGGAAVGRFGPVATMCRRDSLAQQFTTLERPPERIRDAKIILGRINRGPAVEILVDPQAPIQVPDELPTYT